jgi:hypothetical protein
MIGTGTEMPQHGQSIVYRLSPSTLQKRSDGEYASAKVCAQSNLDTPAMNSPCLLT